MAPSPPAKRFLPEPVETTVRTSRNPKSAADKSKATSPDSGDHSTPDMNGTSMTTTTQPRRFKPEPIEESTRSSRKQRPQHVEHVKEETAQTSDSTAPSQPSTQATQPKPRRFAPEPVESSARSSRRKFAPEPVETSTRSSKDKEKSPPSKPRKFAVQAVETSTRSRRAGAEDSETSRSAPQVRRKFAPEPISTEKLSSRKTSRMSVDSDQSPEQSRSRGSSTQSHQSANGTRRFSPDLIETAKGTFRQSVVPSPTKAETTLTPTLEDEEEESDDDVGSLTESRFSAAALSKRNREEQRRRSFAVPDLPMIESDSGDDSSAPSLTNSRSSAESDQQRKNSRRAAGDSYTDYVLRLAKQNATEKEIHDQAMAAYINEVPHQAPAHYGFDDEDDAVSIRVGKFTGTNGADAQTFRRHSQDDLDWEMAEMQRHHAQLEEAKRQLKHDTAGQSRFSAAALATRHKLEAEKQSKTKKLKAEETELAKMRAAASPPMLGDDLIFPQTLSPKMTRCETDQHPRPRTAESDDEGDEEEIGQQALWSTTVQRVKVSPTPSQGSGAGLWGGFCNLNDSQPNTPKRTGLMTPAVERDNPFETTTPGRKTPGGSKTPRRRMYGMNLLPLTPQRTNEEDMLSSVDRKLQLERQIDEEFGDAVVTQIYNYLSLGYPSLAWGFDEELSKISRISVEELRKDDERMDAKGYVGVPEGEGVGLGEGGCRRWEALRLYVREWARQSPGFVDDAAGTGGGVGRGWGGNAGARRGSWGN